MTKETTPKVIIDKDIIAFGKVLEIIGQKLQEEPTILLAFLKEKKITSRPIKLNQHDYSRVEMFYLHEFLKEHNANILRNKLEDFEVEELKYLIKKYNLGSTRLKNKNRIIDFIVESSLNKSVDVFINVGDENN